MRFDASQQMRLGQQMKLAPRMIQSMEILQMPLTELEERIERELESNPTLEVQEPQPEEETPDRPAPPIEARARVSSGERDAKQDAMAAAPARAESLTEQLLHQWSLTDVEASLRPLGELIISFLDEDGYLRTPLETIADRAPARPEWGGKPEVAALARALTAVQLFLEPAGVGARDVRECMLLQLDAMGDRAERPVSDEDLSTARLLVSEHLDDLKQNRLPRIVGRAGLSMERIKAGIEVIRRLDLAPARSLVSTSAAPVYPDAIVEYDEDSDRYIAYLNDSRVPNLRINQEYARLASDRSFEKKGREFIRTNLSNARWLLDALQQRKQTLLRVIGVVVEAQRDYFDYGPQALKPLPMTQVAEQLGIHVATVSRAVADKMLLTPRGVVPLRSFFSGGLATESGEDMSYDAVRAALKEVVDAEDKSKPLSDEALVEALHKRGIEIARRTVAKYRDQLAIPTARLRRAF